MESPFTVEKLDHIVLRVRDLEKSVAFYEMFGGRPAASSGAINTRPRLGVRFSYGSPVSPPWKIWGLPSATTVASVPSGRRMVRGARSRYLVGTRPVQRSAAIWR